MRTFTLALLIASAPMAPAFADNHDWPQEGDLSIEQAMEIAYGEGIAVLREVSFDDGRWEIEGLSNAGAEIEFDINGTTGEIIGRQ
ncbi:PepSY domain-containing protein [Pelagibacterium sp.]|uniref:PepSY domain-containing protein n=1 Tax=Pelagibacterium sp. TaxID=1967288 RepID=UPI003A8F54AD